MRRFLSNIVLALTVFLLMLLLAEGVWRLFVSSGDRARHFDPEIGRVNPPSTMWTIRTTEYVTRMETNSRGFRGPELPTERVPGEFRVLFLGDSFVEAKQVPLEERFVEQTERLLEERWQRPVTARALAVGASEPAREYLSYEHLGASFDPDVVVQVFFLENDLLGMSGAYLFRTVNGRLTLERAWVDPPPPCNISCLLLSKSELALRTYRLLRQFRSAAPKDVRAHLGEGEFYWYTIEGQEAAERERRFEVLAAFADAVRRRTESDSGIYIAVLMPGGFEIHDAWQEQVKARFAGLVPEAAWRPSGLLDRGAAALRRRGVTVLDLRSAFSKAAEQGLLYYTIDPHLNLDGHRVATEQITAAILRIHP